MGRLEVAGAARPSWRGLVCGRLPGVAGLILTTGLSACLGQRVATGSGGSGSGGQSADGSGGNTIAAGLTRRVRRLSNHEYDNVVRDLLGEATQPSLGLVISDSFPNGYD